MFTFLEDLLNLFYPEVCAACGNGLFTGERAICTVCRAFLPKTGFETVAGNSVEKQFWGKVQIHAATALYHFNKGEKVQHLIHRLKYKGDQEVGREAGRILGSSLKSSPLFAGISCVVPVPLHRERLRTRGYNQSQAFAEGIAELLGVEARPDLLVRARASNSQTRKSRYERWENVGNAFTAGREEALKDLHVLLVDDVITTGSTLSACAEAVLNAGAARVSIASIAFATR
jgi:ComF family protein